MDHENCQLHISKFSDNVLEGHKTAELFAHLGVCEECRAFFQSMLQLRLKLRNAQPLLLPDEIDAAVFAATINKQPSRIVSKAENWFLRLWRGRVSFPVPIAAVLVFLFVLAGTVISSLWWESNKSTTEYYIPVLPTVEVRGYSDAPQHTSSKEVKQ